MQIHLSSEGNVGFVLAEGMAVWGWGDTQHLEKKPQNLLTDPQSTSKR